MSVPRFDPAGRAVHGALPMMARRPWLVVVLWLCLLGASAPFALHVTQYLSSGGFAAPGDPSGWANSTTRDLSPPGSVPTTLVRGIAASEVLALAVRAGVPAGDVHGLSARSAVIVPKAGQGPLSRLVAALRRAGAALKPVTAATLGGEVSHDSEATLGASTKLVLPVLVLLLLLVFGAILPAFLPFLTAAFGAVLALAALSLLGRVVPLSIYLLDIVTFLALGVGVDYALFISSRFRDRLEVGADPVEALSTAMRTAGRSVLFSGVAVALALSTLVLGGTTYWRGLALGGAIAVASVMLATHTLLPALLQILRRRISFGRIPFAMSTWPLWGSLARWATGRPWLALVCGVIVLSVPAGFGPGLQMKIPANLASMLAPASALHRASGIQQAVFGLGSVAPYVVALRVSQPLETAAAWRTVAAATRALEGTPGVASVASPTSMGVPPARLSAWSAAMAGPAPLGLVPPKALRAFINPAMRPHVVDLSVIGRYDPNGAKAAALVGRMRRAVARAVPAGTRVAVGGAVAQLSAFDRFVDERLPWILVAVAAVAFFVLLWATGSIAQAALGVGLNGLVTLATAGILVLTVQRGSLGLAPQSPNLTIVPLVFVLLFGLSMDYEVILLHRIQEELHRGLESREAARIGIAATGGIITGAGLVMVAVFFVLLLSPLELLKMLAIGMTSALILDTWVVRTFLVPSITTLLGRYAFWPWGGAPRRAPAPAAGGR